MSTSTTLIKIQVQDDVFTMPRSAASLMVTINSVLEDARCDDDVIPITDPTISPSTMGLVIEYCNFLDNHNNQLKQLTEGDEDKMEKERLMNAKSKFDANYLQVNADHRISFAIANAANFLYFKELTKLIASDISNQIKSRTPAEIMMHFKISPDEATPARMEEVKKNHAYVFEKHRKKIEAAAAGAREKTEAQRNATAAAAAANGYAASSDASSSSDDE